MNLIKQVQNKNDTMARFFSNENLHLKKSFYSNKINSILISAADALLAAEICTMLKSRKQTDGELTVISTITLTNCCSELCT